MSDDKLYCKITVTGLVQGVGFRPAIVEMAEDCTITGYVKNLGGIVEIIAAGDSKAMENFLYRLKCVSVVRIDSIEVEELKLLRKDNDVVVISDKISAEYIVHNQKFQIAESNQNKDIHRILPVDFPTCNSCKAELFDSKNRRYRYPFISCTQCGPRYSILKNIPYDRESITMDAFEMCPECKTEYTQKGNIRRHAQTIGCHNCGPQLQMVTYDRENDAFYEIKDDTEQILQKAINALGEGKILAVKDIGGYHFALSPFHGHTARRLREFKNREAKPFAVMFDSIETIKEYCNVSQKEEELLLSNERPIVLLTKRRCFPEGICDNTNLLGAMLPCNPLQMLLLEKTKQLVMTSGNKGGEPIIVDDEEMKELLCQGCPDIMLAHDREILAPLDDSIYQINAGKVQIIRRARGLVPEPIEMKNALQKDVFAAGGDLKATFAFGRKHLVYLSQYFGDLEDVRCAKAREKEITRMTTLLDISPEVFIGDLHPSYISAQGMKEKIQHHHAHAASVIAEHGLEGKVLGIVCDGTGYGTDGTIWGGEFLLCENCKMHRTGYLTPVKLLGGDSSAKNADMTLLSYILTAAERGIEVKEFFEDIAQREDSQSNKMQMMAWKQNINTVYSSSLGRLFDAAAAVLDICHYNSYEGECAIRLEQAANWGLHGINDNPDADWLDELTLLSDIETEGHTIDSCRMIANLYALKKQFQKEDIKQWQEILAYVFHKSLICAICNLAEAFKEEYNVTQVALSGGCFQNRILLSGVVGELEAKGFLVYTNEKVPCGDGGLALGQMYLASFLE